MLTINNYYYPSDKMCDQISDAILDACFKEDPDSKVACGKLTNKFIML